VRKGSAGHPVRQRWGNDNQPIARAGNQVDQGVVGGEGKRARHVSSPVAARPTPAAPDWQCDTRRTSDLILLEHAEGLRRIVRPLHVGWVEDVAQLVPCEAVCMRVPGVALRTNVRAPFVVRAGKAAWHRMNFRKPELILHSAVRNRGQGTAA
jgi:hypothetical protein